MKAAAGRQVELRSFGDAGAAAGAGGEDGLQHTRLLGGDEEDGGGHEEHGDHEHLSSNTRAFVNTFISFVGAGMLSLPFAFRQAGWLLCLFALLGVAALCTYCMVLLVECKYMLKSKGAVTYGDVVWHALGLPGLIAVEVSLVITQAGFSTAYLVFIGRNLNQLFDLPEDPVILACLPALVALCLLRHLKYLAPFSLIAECVNLTGLLVVYAVDFEYMHVNHPSVEWANWASLPFALGVCLYCFEGMGMTLSLEGSMLKKHDFIPVCTASCTYHCFAPADMPSVGSQLGHAGLLWPLRHHGHLWIPRLRF
jgi:proton-coupled amino acid transporter